MRAQPDTSAAHTVPLVVTDVEEELLDQTPPPDHGGWLEARESGLQWTRKRWELRRRLKLEREAAETEAASQPPESLGSSPH
jgi:hypothetical protein